ncbi:MAG TPA: hypothetical protein VJU59_07955, partial [Paraburkholderia sp.]|uniref:hypothetical protein n=1 Tax=Paraburkholderia sp. TaxID=1926495 RepID=UPI002B45C1F3
WRAAAVAMMASMMTAGAAFAGETSGGQTSSAPAPAVWSRHALIVDLHDLPRRYTCDELWYKFRDVLLAIGAAPQMRILPYRCERRVGAIAYSPKVELDFSLPRILSVENSGGATLEVVPKDVTLEPDKLPHIGPQDCELLNQMRFTFFKAIGEAVKTYHLACQAPVSSTPAFAMTVQTLARVPQRVSAIAPVPQSHGGALTGRG